MALVIIFRSLGILAPIAVLPAALTISSTTLNHHQLAAIFALPILAMHGLNLYFLSDFGGIPLQFISVLHSLWTMDLLLWRDPRRDFKLLHRTSGPIKSNTKIKKENQLVWEEAYPELMTRRASWIWNLVWSWRYTNWNTGHPKSTTLHKYQPSPAISSISYIRQTFPEMLLMYLCLDIVTYLSSPDPYWSSPLSLSISAPFSSPGLQLPNLLSSILASGSFARATRTAIMAFRYYASLQLGYWISILPILLLGHWRILGAEWGTPHAWPPFLGGLGMISEKGVGGFWGDTWHQSMRYVRHFQTHHQHKY
jgi:hypothetical protein